jgi:hypothetical protein
MSAYSIYIPRIFNNIPNKKIKDVFEANNLGTISSINIIYKYGQNGDKYKMAFIHFTQWNMSNIAALNLKAMIDDPTKEARLIYDNPPWYWILLPNTSNNRIQSNQIELTTCMDRINKLEQQITCMYEELYRRDYYYEPNQIGEITPILADTSFYDHSGMNDSNVQYTSYGEEEDYNNDYIQDDFTDFEMSENILFSEANWRNLPSYKQTMATK